MIQKYFIEFVLLLVILGVLGWSWYSDEDPEKPDDTDCIQYTALRSDCDDTGFCKIHTEEGEVIGAFDPQKPGEAFKVCTIQIPYE